MEPIETSEGEKPPKNEVRPEIERLKSEFRNKGWGRLKPGKYAGFQFDLIGRKFLPNYWYLLIKKIPLVDKAAVKGLKNVFDTLKIRRYEMSVQGFLLCVITESVAEDIRLPAGSLDSIENASLLILDKINMRMYGDIVYGTGNVYETMCRQMNMAENILREAYNPDQRKDILPQKDFVPRFPPRHRTFEGIFITGLLLPPVGLALMWSGEVYDDTDEQNQNAVWPVWKKIVFTVFIVLLHLFLYYFGIYDMASHALFGKDLLCSAAG